MTKQFRETRWSIKWWLATVLTAIFLPAVVSVAVAQTTADQPPLVLSKTTEVDLAVAGDTLTYLLVLTNTGQIPLEEVVVSDLTPAGTTLFGVSGPPKWKMTSPGPSQSGEVTWQAMDPLLAGEAVTLKLIVTINLEATGSIINDSYAARAQGWAESVAGPPVITRLILPAPTWTPPLLPTETPTETPTGAPTKIPPAVTPVTTPTATATSPPDVVLEQVQLSTPTSLPTKSAPSEKTTAGAGVGVIGLIVLGLIVIAISAVFIIKRRA